jgi:outer membrane protein
MTRHRRGGALICGALAFLIGALSAAPGAADIKIGFIDSEQIFSKYEKTKEAQESFNREVQELSKTAREKKFEIDDLQRKLETQGPMLSEAKRDEQNQILQKKISEYEAFVQSNWGPGGQVSLLNEEYLRPIINRVHAIVTAIATDEGYSLVLDAADGNIIFGDRALDLTERVLTGLRQEDAGQPFRTTKSSGSTSGQQTGSQGNPPAGQ